MKKLGLLAALLLPFTVSVALLTPTVAQCAPKKKVPKKPVKKVEAPPPPPVEEPPKEAPPPAPAPVEEDERGDRGGKVY